MKKNLFASAAVAAVVAFSGAAWAQATATATTDLNLRAGPGPQHEVIGVINAEGEVTVNGCIEGSKWCRVTHDGEEGWAFSDYLVTDLSGSQVVIAERRADVGVPVVTFEADAGTQAGGTAGVTTGAVGGAIAGALIGGPVGAVVGGIAGAGAGGVAGAATGAAIDPEVRTYVTANPADPVFLEGEVVVGAGIPEGVELRTIPTTEEYRYAYINGVPVIVRTSDRVIVDVVRRS